MMDDLSNKFLFDELERLIKAEEGIQNGRNAILNQLFTGVGVGSAVWASISKDAFTLTDQLSVLQPSYLFATLWIFSIIFVGSVFCWLRLMNNALNLGIVRAKRMVIRRELSKIKYCLVGYIDDDINTADAGNRISVQVQGFPMRTKLVFVLFAVVLSAFGAGCAMIARHLWAQASFQASNQVQLTIAIAIFSFLFFALLIILIICIRRAGARNRQILGLLQHDEIKPVGNLINI